MKTQNFGIEIEMTGITRSTASKVIAGYFNTTATHIGGVYDSYSIRDTDDRQWKIVRDASVRCENRSGQNASSLYSVEFVSPICTYDDIETIQELVRNLRGAGARVNSSCGIHVHINASPKPEAHGIETWYYAKSAQGANFARAVHAEIRDVYSTLDRGVKASQGFYVLKYTHMPAILQSIP